MSLLVSESKIVKYVILYFSKVLQVLHYFSDSFTSRKKICCSFDSSSYRPFSRRSRSSAIPSTLSALFNMLYFTYSTSHSHPMFFIFLSLYKFKSPTTLLEIFSSVSHSVLLQFLFESNLLQLI